MKKPVGIEVIAILAIIGGVLGLCMPILVFMGSPFLGPIFGTMGIIAGILLIIGPILQLAFGIGALKLRKWAWYLGIISTGINVLGVIVNLFQGGSFLSAIWGSIIPVIIFIYLLSSNVRKAFGVGSQPSAAPAAAPVQAAPPAPPAPAETPEPPDEEQE
jgi:hypothetical protein